MGTSSRNGTNILISVVVAIVLLATLIVTAWGCARARAIVKPDDKNSKEWIEANIYSENTKYIKLSDGSYVHIDNMDKYLADKYAEDDPYSQWYTSHSISFDTDGKLLNTNVNLSQDITMVYKDTYGRGQTSSRDAALTYISTLTKYSNLFDREIYFDSEREAIDSFKNYLVEHNNYVKATWYSYDNSSWYTTPDEARLVTADTVEVKVRDINCFWNSTYCNLNEGLARVDAVSARRSTVRYVNSQYQYTNIFGTTYYFNTQFDVNGFIDSDVEGSRSFKNEFSYNNFATVFPLESLAREAYANTLTNPTSKERYSFDGTSSFATIDEAKVAYRNTIRDEQAKVMTTRWYKPSLLTDLGYVKEDRELVIKETEKLLEFQMAIKGEKVDNYDTYELVSVYKYQGEESYYDSIDNIFKRFKKDIYALSTEVSKLSYKLKDTSMWFDSYEECRDYWVSQIKN